MIERMPGENTPRETRREAHDIVNKQKRYQQIIECLQEAGPMSAKEIAVRMFAKGYTPSSERNFTAPRLTEMSAMGVVEPVGKKKCKFTGRNVAVYDMRYET